MTTKDEALKLALEALDVLLTEPIAHKAADMAEYLLLQAAPAIREALAEQPAQQEPPIVAELLCVCGAEWEWRNRDWELVATPPEQRKPLTDEEIKLVMDGRGEEGDDDYVKPAFDPFGISEDDLMNFARAIEAAHGIKGDA